MSDGPPSDREVIECCQRGEVEPFGLLVRRYQDRVYGLAYRMLGHAEDAQDAAQEAFIKAFGALQRFDVERPFAPWLVTIATNVCVGMLRRRRGDFVALDAMEPEAAEALLDAATPERRADGDPEAALLQAVEDAEIHAAVLALPDAYRTVVLLRYQEHLSYDEIARALDAPLGTVKTLLHRAHHRLRRALTQGIEE